MWPYHPDLLATPVPRYTSFPTAADFGTVTGADYRDALINAHGEISLYLHIPFCEQICHYCGCNTGRANRRQRLQSYLQALHREIEIVGSLLPETAFVTRVSFGGGSPNAIWPLDMLRLVNALTVHFRLEDPVFSTELDPRTMSADWCETLQAIGFQRASLGVQTFAPHCQRAIGREQSESMIAQTTAWLREAGVSSINFDLMYGLPGQREEDLLDSLARTRALGADRVALFGYAHVPHVVPRQRVIDASILPDQEARFAMAALGHEELCSHGYSPIGFDHFARAGSDPLARAASEGRLRRNFQGFTDDKAAVLIGLGASAISSFPHLLAQNEKNSGRYRMALSQRQLPVTRGIHRDADDRLRGNIIERLLCQGSARVPPVLLAQLQSRLCQFAVRGLVEINDDSLSITPAGLPYSRAIAAIFDPYREQSVRQFSSAV